ncbi:Glycosyltransferase family 92 [Dillenia turbinata]|uniref:Glycosyltransferase family 92 protein n=1 Tax=Dillenia turbinata TaxID=194707 RepID=A0AAN8UUB7_9MAGN
MGKQQQMEKERDRNMFVGVIWNYASELKYLIMAFFILCSIATLLQFLPSHFTLSSSDLRLCLSRLASDQLSPPSSTPIPPTPVLHNSLLASSISSPAPLPPPPPPPPALEQDQILEGGILKRSFSTFGAAAYNLIVMGAYRGGLDTFAVVALSSKPLHVFGRPSYSCEWVPLDKSSPPITGATYKILPDWGYGRVYTVVVVNCTFPHPVGVEAGGSLFIHASTNGGGDTSYNLTDTIEALRETPGSVNFSLYTSPPKYDYLYCGSSLYGNLSPQRMREWMAFHVRLFGPKSHFVIHDAGGVHPEVMEVLKPWMELGYVTLQDIRDQERFDGYYHNQFLIVNDCLHRYRFDAQWMFFFDVDEFIYIPSKKTIKSVLDSLTDYNQVTIVQMTMSNQLCHSEDYGKTPKKWGFEKLVYRDVKRGIRRDRKYAIQPRNVFATGVHMSQNLKGRTNHKTDRNIKYFHYHGTIAERREPCRQLVNTTDITLDGTPYVLDRTMRKVANIVKRFELRTIGSRLKHTRQ